MEIKLSIPFFLKDSCYRAVEKEQLLSNSISTSCDNGPYKVVFEIFLHLKNGAKSLCRYQSRWHSGTWAHGGTTVV